MKHVYPSVHPHTHTYTHHTTHIQAMIASSKNSSMKTDYQDESSRNRLFVVCPRDCTEDDLKAKFIDFGHFDYCNIIRDKNTGESKGFGYVKFSKASTAAIAMENCDKSLKAILAEPKSAKFAREAAAAAVAKEQQRHSLRDSFMMQESTSPTHSTMDLFLGGNGASSSPTYQGGSPRYQPQSTSPGIELGINNRLFVLVSPIVSQEQLSRLFDLVPGMESCDLKRNHATGDSRGFAYVSYTSLSAAMYAREKLNGFEYPPASKLVVKYAEDPPIHYPPSPTAEPVYFHSAPHSPLRSPIKGSPVRSLSPVRPMVTRQRRHSFSSEFDGRVFFICNPQPPAEHVLRDVFARFGLLTDIWVVRGKNYGYAKFTTRSSAEAAITALHGMEVFGTKLKVMLADPPPEDGSRNKRPRKYVHVRVCMRGRCFRGSHIYFINYKVTCFVIKRIAVILLILRSPC